MLGADSRIIQASAHAVRSGNLTELVLQDVGFRAVQHALDAVHQRGRIIADGSAAAAGFHADQLHGAILHERVEDAHSIASAPHAGHHVVGK